MGSYCLLTCLEIHVAIHTYGREDDWKYRDRREGGQLEIGRMIDGSYPTKEVKMMRNNSRIQENICLFILSLDNNCH